MLAREDKGEGAALMLPFPLPGTTEAASAKSPPKPDANDTAEEPLELGTDTARASEGVAIAAEEEEGELSDEEGCDGATDTAATGGGGDCCCNLCARNDAPRPEQAGADGANEGEAEG